MKKILLFAGFFIINYSFSQTKFMVSAGVADYNGLRDVIQTPNGNYIATGYIHAYGYKTADAYIVKINGNGQQIWSKSATTDKEDEGYSIINTADGGFAIEGTINDKMSLSKFDAAGNLSWAKQYNEFESGNGTKMMQTSDGGYLLPGVSYINWLLGQSYLIKVNASGTVEWAKSYFTAVSSVIYDIKKTNDNNYIFLATNFTAHFNDSTYIVKVNSSGAVLWCKCFYAASKQVAGYRLLNTSDGGCLVAGGVYNGNTGDERGFLLKMDADGNKQWSKITNNQQEQEDGNLSFTDAVQTGDGGYVGVGSGWDFYYFLKVNSDGSLVWAKKIPVKKGGSIYLNRIIKTSDGGYIAASEEEDELGYEGSLVNVGRLIKFNANFSTCLPNISFGSLVNFGTFGNGSVPTSASNTVTTTITPVIALTGKVTNVCNTLPLSLLNFSAGQKAKSIQLQWETAEEENTSYFDIEKSNDGKVFNRFSRVAAAGNSATIKSYTSEDNNPFRGDNWYRLKMVDKDGQYDYSNTAKISYTGENNILLYPNPAVNNAMIVFKAEKTGSYSIRITDVSGKVLYTVNGITAMGENRITLPVSTYAKGMYIVNFTTETIKTTFKLNKQ